MDVRVMFGVRGDREQKKISQMIAADRYCQELQSKGILTLVGAALNLYNMLMSINDKIDLRVYPTTFEAVQRQELIKINAKKLEQKYNEESYRNPGIPPDSIREFLIKMYWMGYQQLPIYDGLRYASGKHLTWDYFVKTLQRLQPSLEISKKPATAKQLAVNPTLKANVHVVASAFLVVRNRGTDQSIGKS